MFHGCHSKGCERAMRAIGAVKCSMPGTTVIMSYCDQPASRVEIRLVSYNLFPEACLIALILISGTLSRHINSEIVNIFYLISFYCFTNNRELIYASVFSAL